MEKPYKGQDPKLGYEDATRPSISEGNSNITGKGHTSADTKAGEGKTTGMQGEKNRKPIPDDEPKDTNIIGNITKLLPANTFLLFQTLAPLATNDGHCGKAEVILTSVVLIILAISCMLVCFTDTVQFHGKVYHGLVTRKGLWNPSFKRDPSFTKLHVSNGELDTYKKNLEEYKKGLTKDNPVKPLPRCAEKPHVHGSTLHTGNSRYHLAFTDFLHAVLSAMAFGTLTMLTSPVSTCFYPNIPSSVVKTLPLLVGFVISAIFAFSPPARNGVAHPLSPKSDGPSLLERYEPTDSEGEDHDSTVPPQQQAREGDHGQAVQGAKDASSTQMHQEPQAATSGPLAGLSRQSSMALTRANSGVQSPSLSLPSVPHALSHQVTQALQRQVSGIFPNEHSAGSEAVARRARLQAGYQLPTSSQLPQAIAHSVMSLAIDAASRLSQSMSNPKAELLKPKDVLIHEMYSQAYPLSTHDRTAIVTTPVESQPTTNEVNPQFVVEALVLGMQKMAEAESQPAASVAIDITSPLQQGSQMHTQLARQASVSPPQIQAGRSMMQRQVSSGNFLQPSAPDTHMALGHLPSQLWPPQRSALQFGVSDWMPTSPSNQRNNASLTNEDVIAAAGAEQPGVDGVQRNATQPPRVTEENVAHATSQAPTAFQVQPKSSEKVSSTSEVAEQVGLVTMTHILQSYQPKSSETSNSFSKEEITSESESELNNHGNLQAGSTSSFNLQGPLKKKL